jgi:uncharacterized cupredoxin-like copper-binding protein
MYIVNKCELAGLVLALVLFGLPSTSPAWIFGDVVTIEQLSFRPDSIKVPGDSFAVLVVQNREDGPILHEVTSQSLFESGTLIQVMGTGKVEYSGNRVSRILLYPGEEVVIWFYAEQGRTYPFQCNINGHAMQGVVKSG